MDDLRLQTETDVRGGREWRDRGAEISRHNGPPSCLGDAVPLYGWGQQAAWGRSSAAGILSSY